MADWTLGAPMGVAMPPELDGGRCLPSPRPRFPPPDAWTSDDRQLRQAAAFACSTCPVLAACRAWVLSLPEPGCKVDSGGPIVAGMDRAQRRAARRALHGAERPADATAAATGDPASRPPGAER
jgi:Transcription factor WhiB